MKKLSLEVLSDYGVNRGSDGKTFDLYFPTGELVENLDSYKLAALRRDLLKIEKEHS